MADFLYLSVFIGLQLCFVIQLYFIFVIHIKLRAFKPAADVVSTTQPVSVIICARNEEENLIKNLPAILEQSYPDFEVVVVNDCSVDDSDLVLKELGLKYPHLKTVNIAEHVRFKHGKKFAATLGIKAAKNEFLVFTDADCQPASPQWLKRMAQHFSGGTEIVLGYSPYLTCSTFVNKLIRFETFFTALNYLSFALADNPYMGVGRNLAYRKSLFFKGKGFASHMHIPSGDDDLFVNQNANFRNTVIEIHPESFVWSEPKRTFSSYLNQKIRHMGAGKAYKASHKLVLSAQAASAIMFYITLFTLIFLGAQWYLLISIYILRLTAQIFTYWQVFKKLAYKDLIWSLPIFDFVYYFYILALTFISLFKKKVQWR